MTPEGGPPSFPVLFARVVLLSAKRRSYRAFLPWVLFLTILFPLSLWWFFASRMVDAVSRSEAISVLSAIAVVGGFLGSASVSIAGQMQKMISEYPFSAYLKKEHLFDLFLFWPQFTLAVQIFNISLSSIMSMTITLGQFDHSAAFFVITSFCFMLYTFLKTWNLVDLVRVVTWHYEDYRRLTEEYKASIAEG